MNKSVKSALIAVTSLIFIGAVALSVRARQADSDEKLKKPSRPKRVTRADIRKASSSVARHRTESELNCKR